MKIALTRKLLLSLAAASAVMIATPALAQNYEAERYGYGVDHPYDVWGRDIDQRQARLMQRATQQASNGRLGQGQYQRLRASFGHFNRLKATYRRHGYTRAEVNHLNTLLEHYQAQLDNGRRNDRWDNRDDRGDRGDRDNRGRRDRYDD